MNKKLLKALQKLTAISASLEGRNPKTMLITIINKETGERLSDAEILAQIQPVNTQEAIELKAKIDAIVAAYPNA